MRECPFPGDGEFSWERFAEVYNSELANNLGNLFSPRDDDHLEELTTACSTGTAGKIPEPVVPGLDLAAFVADVRGHVEACRYNLALQAIVLEFPDADEPVSRSERSWKLVKTDKEAAKRVLFNAVQSLRIASILLKPFIPRSAETIYTSFNFSTPWENVRSTPTRRS